MSTHRASQIEWAQTLWGVGYLLIGVAIATISAWPVYDTQQVILIAAVGSVAAIGLALLARRFAWSWWLTTLVAIGFYLVAVVPLAIPSALDSPVDALRGVRDGVAAVIVGWRQLLTLNLPLQDYQAVLAPFLIVVFVGVLAAALLVVRGRRLALLVVPIVLLINAFGPAFGSSSTGAPLLIGAFGVPAPEQLVLGVGLILVSLAWLVGRSRINRARSLRAARGQTGTVRQQRESVVFTLRRNILAGSIIVIALIAGIAFAPVAVGIQPRSALRDGIDPDLVVQKQTSPLSSYRKWFDANNFSAPLFTVSGASKSVDRIRIATLDTYDGEDFDVSGSAAGDTGDFSRLPRTTPDSPNDVSLTITIGSAYSGIWLPAPNGLAAAPTFLGSNSTALSDAFYINTSDASAIDVAQNPAARTGLLPGDSYRVYADPTADSASSLGSAAGGQSEINPADYPALVDWVKAQKVQRTASGLRTLITRLVARGYVSHSIAQSAGAKKWIAALQAKSPYAFEPSYSGHSISRVDDLFTSLLNQQRAAGSAATPTQLVSGVGDDEQFSTAAALLARYFGFDSRVVLGVRLGSAPADSPVAACTDVCTGSNVSAWIEVSRQGGPWVTFDTTPQFKLAPTQVTQGEQLPSNPTIPAQTKSTVVQAPQTSRDDSNSHSPKTAGDTAWIAVLLAVLRIAGISLLVLLLILLPALVILFAKSFRRRSRRDARVPEVGLVGAWYELVDLYVDNGIALPRDASRQQIAAVANRPAAAQLANAVDRAVFAEHPPLRDASTAAWQLVDAERAELEQSVGFWRRILLRLGLASFIRQLDPASLAASAFSVFRRKERAS